ncbi:hypothetical protein Q0M94_11800 [Deinococcus radiomollis]|uniref:hypothetical protein n=1 Tax=Deinococcus radiomollis TaxID=468916 RepID=UPI003891A25A
MRFKVVGGIETTPEGFGKIAELYRDVILYRVKGGKEDAIIDLSGLSWIDANMCAPLGGSIIRLIKETESIKLAQPFRSSVKDILMRNGFIPHLLKIQKVVDVHKTTVEFKMFSADTNGERTFAGHAYNIFDDRDTFRTTQNLKRALIRNTLEIFNNSVTHSQSSLGIFACGQFYPRKHRMKLTISDVGSGILPVVSRYLKRFDMSAVDAISWAVQKGNTTKTSMPGGLGLGLLFEFVTANGGAMQIVSNNGLWQLDKGIISHTEISGPLPGTSVSLSINTAVDTIYGLAEEPPFDLSDIF